MKGKRNPFVNGVFYCKIYISDQIQTESWLSFIIRNENVREHDECRPRWNVT